MKHCKVWYYDILERTSAESYKRPWFQLKILFPFWKVLSYYLLKINFTILKTKLDIFVSINKLIWILSFFLKTISIKIMSIRKYTCHLLANIFKFLLSFSFLTAYSREIRSSSSFSCSRLWISSSSFFCSSFASENSSIMWLLQQKKTFFLKQYHLNC